jgi:anti-sigma-K factor RsiG
VDTFPDLGSLSDVELKDLIQQLTDEEVDISYKRRILHGKIDILRAELVNRLRKKHEGGEDIITGDDVQRLTDILSAGREEGAGGGEGDEGLAGLGGPLAEDEPPSGAV